MTQEERIQQLEKKLEELYLVLEHTRHKRDRFWYKLNECRDQLLAFRTSEVRLRKQLAEKDKALQAENARADQQLQNSIGLLAIIDAHKEENEQLRKQLAEKDRQLQDEQTKSKSIQQCLDVTNASFQKLVDKSEKLKLELQEARERIKYKDELLEEYKELTFSNEETKDATIARLNLVRRTYAEEIQRLRDLVGSEKAVLQQLREQNALQQQMLEAMGRKCNEKMTGSITQITPKTLESLGFKPLEGFRSWYWRYYNVLTIYVIPAGIIDRQSVSLRHMEHTVVLPGVESLEDLQTLQTYITGKKNLPI